MTAIRGVRTLQALLFCAIVGGLSGALCPAPARALAADEWQTRSTSYFTIYYTAADASTAAQYAAVVDDLYAYVAAVFDHGPATPVPLRLYSTVEAYGEANPIARFVSGVVAHADPRRGEIGIATSRLANASPAQVRDTIRHELMHLTATELSADRLPIAFQEGLAQYAEREDADRRDLVRALATARGQGRLLSWEALNDPRRFVGRINVAYPQALSMVAFLLDRHGPGAFKRYLLALHDADGSWTDVLAATYGRPLGEIEADWREYLPDYLGGGWQTDVLRALDLSEPRQRLAAREYEAARELFAEAARLHTELDQPRLAAEAERGRQRAEDSLAASDLAARGRAALDQRDYAPAADLLAQADAHFASAEDEGSRASLADGLAQARLGVEADEHLAAAQALIASWRYPDGRARSLEAAARYRDLDDAANWQRAVSLQGEAETGQRHLALGLLALGAMLLLAVLAWWGRRLRQRREAQPVPWPGAAGEEGIAL